MNKITMLLVLSSVIFSADATNYKIAQINYYKIAQAIGSQQLTYLTMDKSILVRLNKLDVEIIKSQQELLNSENEDMLKMANIRLRFLNQKVNSVINEFTNGKQINTETIIKDYVVQEYSKDFIGIVPFNGFNAPEILASKITIVDITDDVTEKIKNTITKQKTILIE